MGPATNPGPFTILAIPVRYGANHESDIVPPTTLPLADGIELVRADYIDIDHF